MNKNILILLICFCSTIELLGFDFQDGDIVFQDGNQSGFNDAVKNVTSSVTGYNFSHCGIYFTEQDGSKYIIEAIFDGVVKTPLDKFLNRHITKNNKPKVVVGRLADSLQKFIPVAIRHALNYLGKDYDFAFDFENDKVYCSELVYFAFKDANNKPLFDTQPMTFVDTNSGTIQSFWLEYFRNLNEEVPEGKLGINPGSLSKSSIIHLVHFYY